MKRLDQVGALLPPLDEPLLDPLDEPLLEPLEDPLLEPLDEPLLEPLDEPLLEPLDEPLLEPLEEPLLEPLDEPLLEPLEDPLLEPLEGPPSSGLGDPAAGLAFVPPPNGPPRGVSLGELHPTARMDAAEMAAAKRVAIPRKGFRTIAALITKGTALTDPTPTALLV